MGVNTLKSLGLYSSRSTTDLDLMEVITETEATKYLKDLTFEEKRKTLP